MRSSCSSIDSREPSTNLAAVAFQVESDAYTGVRVEERADHVDMVPIDEEWNMLSLDGSQTESDIADLSRLFQADALHPFLQALDDAALMLALEVFGLEGGVVDRVIQAERFPADLLTGEGQAGNAERFERKHVAGPRRVHDFGSVKGAVKPALFQVYRLRLFIAFTEAQLVDTVSELA